MSPKPSGDGRVEVRVTMLADPIRVRPDEIPALRSQGILVEPETGETAGSASDAAGGDPGTSAGDTAGRPRRQRGAGDALDASTIPQGSTAP